MIHYQLQCSAGHEFDGWFKDSVGFERQAEARLLACPRCADAEITRAVMAPRIASGRAQAEKLSAPEAGSASGQQVAVKMPDELRAVLARLRSEVEQRCDYVGENFAAEARAIHEGTSPARGIYGEATEAEAEALAENDIEVVRIPWVPRADS